MPICGIGTLHHFELALISKDSISIEIDSNKESMKKKYIYTR